MCCFRTPIGNERVNGFQTLQKSARNNYYLVFSKIRGKLSLKKSALVRSESMRLLVNILTEDDKYSRSNMQNSPQQFQPLLSQKQKTFSGLVIAFLKCAWNLGDFQKKDEYPSLSFPEVIDAERRAYLTVWKVFLQNTIR